MISAIVLAAGESRRMGRAKPLLRLGGATLLERCLANLRASRVAQIIVVLGHEAATVRARVRLAGVAVRVNKRYREGMSSSIRVGLKALDPAARAALIVLADQPFVASAVVNRIVRAYEESGRRIVIPVCGGIRGNPVLVDRSLFREFERIRGDVGFRAVFDRHEEDIREVPVEDPGILVDIDRPEDYRRAQRIALRIAKARGASVGGSRRARG